MASIINTRLLRDGTPQQQADHFMTLLSFMTVLSAPAMVQAKAAMAEDLLELISAGRVPPRTIGRWLVTSRDPAAILAALRQTHSVTVRRIAINQLGRQLRSSRTFSAAWDAIGGAIGLAALMRDLSVHDIKHLCQALGRTAAALGAAREERQKCLASLVTLLESADGKELDPRPLREFYCLIVPACTVDVAGWWKADRPETELNRARLARAHPEFYEIRVMEQNFPPRSHQARLSEVRPLSCVNPHFRLRVLNRITEEPSVEVVPDEFMRDLALPLARRALRRRSDKEAQLGILSTIVRCVRQRPTLAASLDVHRLGLVYFVVMFWTRSGQYKPAAQALLAELLNLVSPERAGGFGEILKLVKRIAWTSRYEFLCLFLQHSASFRVNVDAPSGADAHRLRSMEGRWPCELLECLPAAHALELLQRLQDMYADEKFLRIPLIIRTSAGTSRSILRQALEPNTDHADPQILQALLMHRSMSSAESTQGPWLERVNGFIAYRKKKAAEGRDPDTRAFWAQSALCLCIAVGSLDLYADILAWARCFNKDPMTVKAIYSSSTVRTVEGANMLCGIPISSRVTATSAADVKTDIEKANGILMRLLQTAIMAQREPSFYREDWHAVFSLFLDVVRLRLRWAGELQERHTLSDEDIFETVWQPTLKMLIEAESTVLRDGQELVRFISTGGFINEKLKISSLTEPSMRFLDTLAQSRNEVWRNHRCRVNPSVMTLDPLWPQGLPIQSLGPLQRESGCRLPYIWKRAREIVFCDPSMALRAPLVDEEVLASIGTYVNDYKIALGYYIESEGDDGSSRETRIRQAWQHVVKHLCGEDRMTAPESITFWKRVLKSLDVKLPEAIDSPLPRRLDPACPAADGIGQPSEWDPDPSYSLCEAKSRKLATTCLDCMLQPSIRFENVTCRTVARTPAAFWSATRFTRPISGKTIDGLVLAAILCLNSSYGTDTSLMMQPFGPANDPRFPAAYLDQDFLERHGKKPFFKPGPISTLERWIMHVPPQLLFRLAHSLLPRLQSGQLVDNDARRVAMKTIQLLSRSDRPWLASQLIQTVLLEKQEDSSWHRFLLNTGFLLELPEKEVLGFFQSLSSSIQEKMREQEKRAYSPDAAPLIKVTTVRLVAHILSSGPFINIGSACALLGGLLAQARHIDIRVTIVNSLLTLLRQTDDEGVKSAIIATLRENAVPLAASLNERRPMTEKDWADVERKGDVPVVQEGISVAPVLDLFLTSTNYAASSVVDKGDKSKPELLAKVMRELIVPALKGSMANNQRWTALFLKKYQFSLPEGEELPAVPVQLAALAKVLQSYGRSMPFWMFETFRKQVLANLRPTAGVATINKTIRASPELRHSNAGVHWLSLWDRTETKEIVQIVRELHKSTWEESSASPGGIDITVLQDFVLDIARILIEDADLERFDRLVTKLAEYNNVPSTAEPRQKKQARTEPVLLRLIDMVDSLRTDAWQADPARRPAALPDTFRIRCAMIPALCETTHEKEPGIRGVDTLVAAVLPLIGELAQSPSLPYHVSYESLKAVVAHRCSWHFLEESVPSRLAVLLGSVPHGLPESAGAAGDGSAPVSGAVELADYLRVELAAHLLLAHHQRRQGQRLPSIKDEGVRDMLRRWEGSRVEAFRVQAAQVKKGFGPDQMAWLRCKMIT